MGILVCYDDFTYDVVTDDRLKELVQTGSIIGYDTSAQWHKFAGEAPGQAVSPDRAREAQNQRCRKKRSANKEGTGEEPPEL